MKYKAVCTLIGIISILSTPLSLGSEAGGIVADLRCELLDNPLGITDLEPALSWKIMDVRRGARQTAYRIHVASSENLLLGGNADLWDSRKVASGQSQFVVYQGKPPSSGQRVWWRVRYWDQNGVGSEWSRPAWWEMGLLSANEFEGDWIRGASQPLPESEIEQQWVRDATIPEAGQWLPQEDRDRVNQAVVEAAADRMRKALPAYQLRREFTLREPVRRARLYVGALGYHQITINGRKLDDHRQEPSFSHYSVRADYVVKDVTASLQVGDNCIGVILGNGRYHEYPGYNDRSYGEMPVLKAMLVAETESGNRVCVTTDRQWKSDVSHITRDSFWVGEVQDARRLQPGWDRADFDDGGWKAVEVVGSGMPGYPLPQAMLAQLHPPEKETERVVPVALDNPAPGVWVFDMGRTLVGNAELRIRAPRGTVVSVRYAHLLWGEYPEWFRRGRLFNPSYVDQSIAQRRGMIVAKNRGDTIKHRANVGGGGVPCLMNADVFVTRGDGEEVFQRKFGYRPFRYVEVRGFPGKPELDAITGVVLHTVLDTSNRSFASANPLFNEIERAVERSVLYNIHGDIQDNAGAEKGFMPHMATWNFPTIALGGEAAALTRKILAELRHYTENVGLTSILTSWRRVPGVPDKDIPPWMSISEMQSYVQLPWQYYLYYGDRRELERNYGFMKRYVQHLYRDVDTKGYLLQDQYGDVWQTSTHYAVKTTFKLDPARGYVPVTRKTIGTPKEFYATVFGYQMASRAEVVARLLGRQSDAEMFAGLRRGAHRFIKDKYYEPESASYCRRVSTSIQGAHAMALSFGVADQSEAPELVRQIREDIRESGSITTGMRLSYSLLEVLSQHGAVDEAFEIMNRTTYPSLGHQLSFYGATPEGFGFPSLPHQGSPVQTEVSQMGVWFYTWLCGLRPDFDRPGFNHFFVSPKVPSRLPSASMEYESPYGRIVIDWKKEANRFRLAVTVPPNATATVAIPRLSGASVDSFREGEQPLSQAGGVSIVSTDEDAVTCELVAGRYEFWYEMR